MFRSPFLALCVSGGLLLTTATAAAADLPAPTGTAPVTGTAAPAGVLPTLTGVRTGRHDTYDRTVFDFTGGTPGFHLGYGPLIEQGRGDVVPVAGAATLVVVLDGLGGVTAGALAQRDPALPTLLQIRSGGAFEGYASLGLGLRDRVGFRVLILHGPDRIAVDVAHQPSQPFGTTAFTHAGTAPDALVEQVRSGSHPGYDRLVLDLAGPATPSVAVSYTGGGSTIRVTLTGSGSATSAPHTAHSGPATSTFGLPQLRTLTFTVPGAGLLTADVGTTRRDGFRVLLLTDPARLVLDVRAGS